MDGGDLRPEESQIAVLALGENALRCPEEVVGGLEEVAVARLERRDLDRGGADDVPLAAEVFASLL